METNFYNLHSFILISDSNEKLNINTLNFLSNLYCKHSFLNSCKNCLKIKNNNKYDILYLGNFQDIIKKEEILKAKENFSLSALEKDNKKVLVIKGIEYGTLSFQNLLLTWLENYDENTYLIFLTNNYNRILPTIKSRVPFFNLDITNKVIQLNENEKKYYNYFLEQNSIKSIDFYNLENSELINLLNKIALEFIKFNSKISNKILESIYTIENSININKKVIIEKMFCDISELL